MCRINLYNSERINLSTYKFIRINLYGNNLLGFMKVKVSKYTFWRVGEGGGKARLPGTPPEGEYFFLHNLVLNLESIYSMWIDNLWLTKICLDIVLISAKLSKYSALWPKNIFKNSKILNFFYLQKSLNLYLQISLKWLCTFSVFLDTTLVKRFGNYFCIFEFAMVRAFQKKIWFIIFRTLIFLHIFYFINLIWL